MFDEFIHRFDGFDDLCNSFSAYRMNGYMSGGFVFDIKGDGMHNESISFSLSIIENEQIHRSLSFGCCSFG